MRTRYKTIGSGDEVYFVTFTIVNHIPVFTHKRYFDIIINNFEWYKEKNGLKICYYVIMDNHVHLILQSINNLSDDIRELKKMIAKQCLDKLKLDNRGWILGLMKTFKKDYKIKSTYQFWEEGSHPQLIQTIDMLNQKADYIHKNPVKRGFVLKEDDWLYSSAKNINKLESCFEIDEINV